MSDTIREAGSKAVVEIEEAQLPELSQTPVTQRGDKWNMDGHWLLCGDATNRQDVHQLMPSTEAAASFVVSWSGTDVGSGIQSYTIYVSDSGGPYGAWLTQTTGTSAKFIGVAGQAKGRPGAMVANIPGPD